MSRREVDRYSIDIAAKSIILIQPRFLYFSLYNIWPARDPAGTNRSKSAQAGFQFLGVIATLGMSIVGGLITGILALFLFGIYSCDVRPKLIDIENRSG